MVQKLKVARTIWSVSLNKEWIAWNKNKVKKFQTKKFWKLMLEQYEYSCCKLFELLVLVFSISPQTRPIKDATQSSKNMSNR